MFRGAFPLGGGREPGDLRCGPKLEPTEASRHSHPLQFGSSIEHEPPRLADGLVSEAPEAPGVHFGLQNDSKCSVRARRSIAFCTLRWIYRLAKSPWNSARLLRAVEVGSATRSQCCRDDVLLFAGVGKALSGFQGAPSHSSAKRMLLRQPFQVKSKWYNCSHRKRHVLRRTSKSRSRWP